MHCIHVNIQATETASENGPHTPGTRQRQGACHIWHMLVPQMSATRAPNTRRADALSSAGLCVWSPSRQRILPSYPASASISDVATAVPGARSNSRAAAAVTPVPSVSPGYCARAQMRAASFSSSVSVRSRDRNSRPNRVPLEMAGRETCMNESSSTSRARWCT